MPFPQSFSSGRTAYQRLFSKPSKLLRTTQSIGPTALYIRQVHGGTGGVSNVAIIPSVRASSAGIHSTASGLRFEVGGLVRLDPEPVDPFLLRQQELTTELYESGIEFQQLVDSFQEVIANSVLRPNEGHESSADANTEEGIKIDQAVDKPVRPFLITSATAVLDEAHREHLWNQIELATFPIDLEIWKAAKEVRRIAFHTLEVALAVTNRRIADGLGDHSSMKPVAKLTEKRLKRQNKKLQWKMGAAPLVFDNHPLFFAVKVSAAKIHMYARRLEYLRARLTGESFPTPLRSDNFHPQLQYKLQVFDPPMSIPKRKPGQMVAWYQEVKHKKIKDNYGPKMTWYHLEVARDGEAQGNQGEGEERRQVMRRHTSRSAWEKNNLYFYNKHNKKVSFQRQKPLKNSPIASPRPAESPVATASHARPQTSPVATSIIRNLPVKSNIEYRRLESTGAAAPKIRKFSIEGPLNIRRLGKPDFPRTPGLIREFHSSTQWSFANAVEETDKLKVRRDKNKAPQTKTPRTIRQILLDAETQRKKTVTAIIQGKVAATAYGEPQPAVMEEDEFVEALQSLANVADEDITEATGMDYLQVGDLVELRGLEGLSELGLFIQAPAATNGEFLFLSETGKIKTWPASCLPFVIPNFMPKSSVELLREFIRQISDEEMMAYPPRHLTKPLVDPIRYFRKKSLEVFARKLPILQKLHENFSHETDGKLVTTIEATQHVFPDGYENHDVYAVHLALMSDNKHFAADSPKAHKKSATFVCRSKRDLKVMQDVTNWVRNRAVDMATGNKTGQGQMFEELLSFTKKAQALIDLHRELRANEKELFQPIQAFPQPKYAWDENDRTIIHFLKLSTSRSWFQESPFTAIVPAILKATERYTKEVKLDHELAYYFLTEIGVYKPWENIYKHSIRVPLPNHGISARVDEVQAKIDDISAEPKAAWEKLQLKDSMEPLRERSEETLYAIDDASAEEIDDAISFERVSNTEAWCHVHIANPTAYIPHDHWLAEAAKERLQTIYSPEQTFGMLPRGLVDYKFGLSSGRPTLTFSGKINTRTGEILEYKITPKIAKEVKRITYEQFNTAIGEKNKKNLVVIINSDPKKAGPARPTEAVAPAEHPALHTIRELAIALKKKRVRDGAATFVEPHYSISVDQNNIPQAPHIDIPTLYSGLPSIRFERSDAPTVAHETVAEYMLLAGRIAGCFLNDRDIAGPYRNNSLSSREGAATVFKDILLPSRNEAGVIPKPVMKAHMGTFGATRLESENKDGHILLGISTGYVKATSPLRRYNDMIVHWQIQHALQAESQGVPASLTPPFTKQYLDWYLPRAEIRERQMNTFATNTLRFWSWRLLQYGRLEGQALGNLNRLPKLTMEISNVNEYPIPCMGQLLEYAMPVKFFFKSKEDWEKASHGEIGEAEFDDLTPSKVRVDMRWKGK